MFQNLRIKAPGASFTHRTIAYLRTSSNEVQKSVIPHLRKPVLRSGQNLSERYKRLERSLRGKESYSKELDVLVRPSTEVSSISSKTRLGNTPQLFHGFVIPEEPKAPADDECCMSGCAVCVYDLYEEALESYQEALSHLRTSLVNKGIPEDQWPQSIQTKSKGSSTSPIPEKRKDVILSAFEEMERALELKRQKAADLEASSKLKSLQGLQMKKRHQVNESMKDAPRDTLLNELYQGLRWILFSSR